jgi:hypothetical protein
VFVGQRIFDADISIRAGRPGDGNLSFSGRFVRGDGMIFLTVPGMVVLGCSIFRAVSRFSSATLADLAMRGFAISFLTSARVAVFGAFLPSLCGIQL